MIDLATLRSSDLVENDSEERGTRTGMAGTGSAVAGKWPVAASLCNRTRLSGTPSWLLGAAIDRRTSCAGVAAGTSSTIGSGGNGGSGDQPAQRAGLDLVAAQRRTSQLAGRIDAGALMQLSADAIWLATAAVDMRTGIDGLSLHVQHV